MAWDWTCFCRSRQLEEKCQGRGSLVIRAFQPAFPFNQDDWEAQVGLLVMFEASGSKRMVGPEDAGELEEANSFFFFSSLVGGVLAKQVAQSLYETKRRKNGV